MSSNLFKRMFAYLGRYKVRLVLVMAAAAHRLQHGEQIGHVRPNHHLVNARIADHLPHAVQRFQRLVVRLAFVRKGKA